MQLIDDHSCIILICTFVIHCGGLLHDIQDEPNVYTNRWAIITKYPEIVASKYGFPILGRVIEKTDIYEMESAGYPKAPLLIHNDLSQKQKLLKIDTHVSYAELQVGRIREVKSYNTEFTDPLCNETWHLNPSRTKDDQRT